VIGFDEQRHEQASDEIGDRVFLSRSALSTIDEGCASARRGDRLEILASVSDQDEVLE